LTSLNIDKITAVLNKTDLFCGLDKSLCAELACKHCKTADYGKGDIIFSDGNKEKCIGVIASGEAVVKKEKLVISRLKAGDIFGAITLYHGSQGFVNDIIACGDCSVIYVSLAGADYLINSSSDFAKRYIEYLSDRIYFLNSKIKSYTTNDAANKLYNYLLGHCNGNSLELNIGMTELASMLNLSRASLYRVISELQDEGKIIKIGRHIELL